MEISVSTTYNDKHTEKETRELREDGRENWPFQWTGEGGRGKERGRIGLGGVEEGGYIQNVQ